TKWRSVSSARPGPSSRGHQISTSALPVSAWQTTIALPPSGASRPHVLKATGTCSRTSPLSSSNRGMISTRSCTMLCRGGACRRGVPSLGRGQTFFDVLDDVVDVLDADRQAHELRRDAGRPLLLLVELRMRRRRRMDRETLRVSDVREVAEELEPFDEPPARVEAALDAEHDHRAAFAAQVLLVQPIGRIVGQPWIADPFDLRVALEVLGDLARVLAVPLHPQRQ